MILNGGEYNGARILSPKTVEMMSADHLSAVYRASGLDKFPNGDLYQGQSMALGFGVVTEAAAMPDLSSNGELSWGGLAGTKFWIDPKEQIIGIALVQQYRSPWSLRADFKNAIYQALEALH
jgi:CubicO group peptidase (beta-lactamase class C family)